MTRKNIFFAAALCAVISLSAASAVLSDGTSESISVRTENSVRGQNESAEKSTSVEKRVSGFFDRVKRSIVNFAKDEDEAETPVNTAQPSNPNAPVEIAIPTTPPKPIKAVEIRNFDQSAPENKLTVAASQQNRSVQLEQKMNSVVKPSPAVTEEAEDTADESKTLRRLQSMRNRMMSDLPVETAQNQTAQITDSQNSPQAPDFGVSRSNTKTVAMPSESIAVQPSVDSPVESIFDKVTKRVEITETFPVITEATPFNPSNSTNVAKAEIQRIDTAKNDIGYNSLRETSSANSDLPPIGGISVGTSTGSKHSLWNQTAKENAGETVAAQKPEEKLPEKLTEKLAEKQLVNRVVGKGKAFLVSPLLEVETEGDSRIVVGKESLYRIRVSNRGGAAAEQVLLTVDIPNWIEILPPDVSTGTTSVVQAANIKGESKESREFVWKISRLDPTAEEQLVLHLVPQERKSVDLRICYDFHKTTAVAKIEVQQPVVEMVLQGPDEVLWGANVGYKLIVKNTGNGDAEKLNLELLQTGSDMKSCTLPVLKAGEEQTIDVDVWTGKQEHIDINILATGSYDVTTQVSKRVKVLRPNISVKVEAPEVQFVDNPAEFHVIVKNEGNAAATNLDLAVSIPLGAKYLTNDSNGKFSQQNIVTWNIPTIAAGDKFAATIICEPKREGICKLEAVVSDISGLVAGSSGSVGAEAIADLRMDVDNPQGPVEVGQEVVYSINVANRGTKPAEDVEVCAAFASGLEPFAVEGANGTMNDGQVVFDKIPSVSAGQTITLKIKVKAEKAGKHRMRAEVNCPGVNAHLLFEQATYCYQKHKNRVGKEGAETNPSANPSPVTLNAVRKESEPKPLRAALPQSVLPEAAPQNAAKPNTVNQNQVLPAVPQGTATALEDPFLR